MRPAFGQRGKPVVFKCKGDGFFGAVHNPTGHPMAQILQQRMPVPLADFPLVIVQTAIIQLQLSVRVSQRH